jgi:phosphatidylserine/phosphatidylglycerophosphate/cardiolipin synthase-like enzyme
MRFLLRGAGVALLSLGLATSLGAASVQAAATTTAIFNDPTGASRYAIRDQLVRLLNSAAVGSVARIAMYRIWDNTLAGAIVAAKNRGVSVQVVLDANDAESGNAAYNTLNTGLGRNRANPSWLVVCTAGKACIGNQGSPINHNKFFLFSSTDGAANVVFQTSSNFSEGNYTNQYNNALQVVGNATLYNGYVAYFNDLAAQGKTNDYYTTVTGGGAKAYFFPRAGSGASTDTVYNALNENVTCPGNSSTGTSGGNTIIRVAMWSFTRTEVAQELRDLANKNCWVDVVYYELSAGVRSALSGHDRIKIYKLLGANETFFVHSKYMAIEGTYAGVKDTKLVFTGSHNFTYSALRENDEALIKMTSNAIHDQYRSNFWLLRSRGVAG